MTRGWAEPETAREKRGGEAKSEGKGKKQQGRKYLSRRSRRKRDCRVANMEKGKMGRKAAGLGVFSSQDPLVRQQASF